MTIEAPQPGHDTPRDLTRVHALSFGQAADLYDAVRPTYPAEALTWALGDERVTVLDVGAGTGLLTRRLITAGHHVIATDPDKQMLEKLIAVSPGLADHRHCGAEELTLPDAHVDVVTAGQSYHWFDPATALPEFVRVLRPGGRFVPMWNVRDESVDWVARLTDIVGAQSAADVTARLAARPGYFAPYFPSHELRVFPHRKTLTPTTLIRLIKSRSYYLTCTPDRKREMLADIERLIAEHPELAGRDTFEMPYLTHAYRMNPVIA
ncbi:class I SAM-dependent methyltransferase [Stackebrandtia soli]|uniref:class I SAM-dependent methyltransferase n=1 Tax=Stackebrandtia soli TaxID=1892856 RepID=UPI0039EC4583